MTIQYGQGDKPSANAEVNVNDRRLDCPLQTSALWYSAALFLTEYTMIESDGGAVGALCASVTWEASAGATAPGAAGAGVATV